MLPETAVKMNYRNVNFFFSGTERLWEISPYLWAQSLISLITIEIKKKISFFEMNWAILIVNDINAFFFSGFHKERKLNVVLEQKYYFYRQCIL